MAKTHSNVEMSKQLSWLLRHGAEKEGLPIQPDGFICVGDILKHPRFRANYSMEKLREIVAADAKQRYTLRKNAITGLEEIRANQGHSLAAVEADACLERIHNLSQLSAGATTADVAVVHGTYYKNWERIKTEGLKRMKRNHLHFALLSGSGNCGGGILSGFRNNCQVLIHLNVSKLLAEQLPLYRSSNNVILCAGIDGCIGIQFFERVVDRATGKLLDF